MAFKPFSPGTGVDHSDMVEVVIANSITINVGEVVQSNSSGFLTNGLAAGGILGIVVGFVQNNDTPIPPAAYAAGTATQTNVTQVIAASNNQTVAQQKALVETSTAKKWSAQVNGTIGTTAASGKIGARIDIDSADTNYDRVLESTATRTAGTVANFYIWGVDSADSTRAVVSIAASERFTKIG